MPNTTWDALPTELIVDEKQKTVFYMEETAKRENTVLLKDTQNLNDG